MARVWDAGTGRLLIATQLAGWGGRPDAGGTGAYAAFAIGPVSLWDIHLADPADALRAAKRSPFVLEGDELEPVLKN